MKTPKQLKSSDVARVREKLLNKQKGKCAICGKPPTRPCLDHHHKKRIHGSGLVRGVLCSACNIFLAKSENNCMRYGFSQAELPHILRKVAKYIEKKHYPLMHPSEAPKAPLLKKQSYNKLIKEMKLSDYSRKFPDYPKSRKLTVPLARLYEQFDIEPEFYK
jgi:hypothetical protein